MVGKVSWRLVIDASITRSAGPGQKMPAQACFEALGDALTICHRIVFSPALRSEWERHRSTHSARWLVSMYARKKVLVLPEPALPNSAWTKKLEAALKRLSQTQRAAAEKDLLLIEAALATDRIVVSLDNTAREIFRQVAADLPALQGLVWANPVTDPGFAAWLEGQTPAPGVMIL